MSQIPVQTCLVLCEGEEDQLVFQAVAQNLNLSGLEFEDYKGKDNLREKLKTLANTGLYTSGAIRRLLVTRDADDDWDSAFAAVAAGVRDFFGVEIQTTGEWVATSVGTEVGIWIAPGANKRGMLETLCLDAARDQDANSFQCLDQFTACVQKEYHCELHDKEQFAIWSIAVQSKTLPRQRMTLKRVLKNIPLPWDSVHFQELRQALSSVAATD